MAGLVLGLAASLGVLLAVIHRPAPRPQPVLGVFTSLPLLWDEAGDVAAQVASGGHRHWVRAALERRAALRPLDHLLDPAVALPRLRFLLMAQPRPLDPAENVALDRWVRGGGRLLLFADPMLTAPSAFPIGDARRPADVVLLSPILAHWGLALRFDEAQPPGLREIAGSGLQGDLVGQLVAREGGVGSRCRISRGGLVAACAVGRGHVLVMADAALLDAVDSPGWRATALESLLDEAFGPDFR